MDGNAGRAETLKLQLLYETIGENVQILSLARGVEIGRCGAASNAVALVQLKATRPQLRCAIEIVVRAMACSHACFDQVIHERMHGAAVLHGQRSGAAVITGTASLVAFRPVTVRRHLAVRPSPPSFLLRPP